MTFLFSSLGKLQSPFLSQKSFETEAPVKPQSPEVQSPFSSVTPKLPVFPAFSVSQTTPKTTGLPEEPAGWSHFLLRSLDVAVSRLIMIICFQIYILIIVNSHGHVGCLAALVVVVMLHIAIRLLVCMIRFIFNKQTTEKNFVSMDAYHQQRSSCERLSQSVGYDTGRGLT